MILFPWTKIPFHALLYQAHRVFVSLDITEHFNNTSKVASGRVFLKDGNDVDDLRQTASSFCFVVAFPKRPVPD
jgi:hypothetical protein